jgi:hypothetical protein
MRNIKHIYENILGSSVIAPSFLTSALDGGELLASNSCRFTHGKEPQVSIG